MTATRTLQFTKMHGAGNDFVVLDATTQELPALEAFSRQLCDRHQGIGTDQLLIVRPAEDTTQADFRMDIYNPDGSQVEMCANGIRAFFKYLRDRNRIEKDEIRVETLSGVVRPRWMGENRIRVDMGRPILQPAKIPTTLGTGDGPVLDVEIEVEGQTVRLSSVSMGNPHAVIEVPHLDTAPVKQLGAAIENHSAFPNRVNVEFIEIIDRGLIRQRTWERGTGETLACGSGACAVAVTAMLRDRTDRAVRVQLRGGELEIQWDAEDQSVFMTGPAIEVFEGQISFEGE